MADLDEDWKKFLNSTEEDEEVETPEEDEPDTPDEDEELDPDDSEEDEEEDEPDEADDPEEDDDAKKGKDGKKKTSGDEYKPHVKQFLNDDGSFNVEKAENQYLESSKRGVELDRKLEEATGKLDRLSADYTALLDAIKAKPDIAKAIFGEEGAKKLANTDTKIKKDDTPTDPLLRHIKAQMDNASTRAYNEFVKDHPEAVTDPERAKKIGVFMKTYGPIYQEENGGEIAPMDEALKAAYRFYGWDLGPTKKEKVGAAAKKVAATRSSGSARRSATKKEASMGEEFFAKKLGVKLK